MKIKHLLCFIALCLFFTPGKAQQLSVMTLRNGATVYIWEDKSKPDVFGMIAFKVGSVRQSRTIHRTGSLLGACHVQRDPNHQCTGLGKRETHL